MRLAALVLALLVGCSDPPAPPPRPVAPTPSREPSPSPSPPAPSPVQEPPRDCELGPEQTWIEDAGPRGSMALGAGPRGPLVAAWSEGTLRTRALTTTGEARGEARATTLEGVSSLVALEARGDRYVLLARGACSESAHCFLARALDGEGAPLGDSLTAALPEDVRTLRRAASEGEGPLFVAWSTSGGHRAIERYELGANGALGRMRIPLGSEPPDPDSPVEILGLAADASRWACVWRRGPTEDVNSDVFLTTGDHHRDVHALHEALAIEVAHLEGETLSVVATFEFSRPHYVRLRAGAEEPLAARELAATEEPPAPLAGRERAELDVDDTGLWLRRRSAAGDAIGAPERIVDGRVESAAIVRRSDAVRLGDALLVGYWRDGAVRGRTVRCARR